MSTETIQVKNGSALFADYDISKLALGNNEFIEGTLTAASGSGALVQGMVMGRVAATQLLTPLVYDATDGSQYPVGIATVTETTADGSSVTLSLINKGKVAESKINFLGSETLASQVGPASNKRSVRDLLNDLGIVLKGGTELTAVDNS